jgi:hypothetical protein
MSRNVLRPAIEPCSVEEWHSRKESRVFEDDLALRSLYMLMFSYEQVAPDWMAGTCPGVITKIARRRNGRVLIKLNLLDVDLQPAMPVRGSVQNGYVLTRETIANRPDSAYLRPYTDDLFVEDFPERSRKLNLPAPVVEPVEVYANA